MTLNSFPTFCKGIGSFQLVNVPINDTVCPPKFHLNEVFTSKKILFGENNISKYN